MTDAPGRSAMDPGTPAVDADQRRGRLFSVCLYTPSADPSGMGAHMLDLAAEYLPHVEVSVMCWATVPGRQLLERAARLGARTLALPPPRDSLFGSALVGFLDEHPADVFHIHVGTGRENFDGARAARRAGVSTIVQTQHQPWLLSSRGKRAPFFRGLQEVDRLIAVSEGQRRTYERIGVPAGRFTTVPNGVRSRGPGLGRRAARAALGLHPDQPVLMTMGRLTPMKGHRFLIECVPGLAADFPGLAVLIFGHGHLQAQLVRQAAELGVGDCVRLVGHRDDARLLLDAADVFVLPSLYEGMPLAALEAMEVGLPVVATRAIGCAEVVADGRTGLLVNHQDARALGRALATLLADAELRARQGRAGRRRYLRRFTSTRMAASTLAVYQQALQSMGAVSVGSSG